MNFASLDSKILPLYTLLANLTSPLPLALLTINMWNDTDVPLAYLITFRSYGTWLHGDGRGSVDRFNNRYKSPYLPPHENWHKYNVKSLKGPPFVMNARQREAVDFAIRDTCAKRRWGLLAISVRTNHAHSVVSIGSTKSDKALNAFKANATREMRERGLWTHDHSPWVHKGSKRSLWNERSIARAIDYVVNGQGDELPDFD